MLRFVPRASLDTARWDAFVTAAPQQIIYGYVWYLDAVCERWQALIQTNDAGDWTAVFAVPLRRKYGFWVVHQPLFCQFLPVFTQPDQTENAAFELFWEAIKKQFWYVSILTVPHWAGSGGLALTEKNTNFVLSLKDKYPQIKANYSADRKNNLAKGQKENWQIIDSQDIEPLIGIFKTHHAHLMHNGVPDRAYAILRGLYAAAKNQNAARLCYSLQAGKTEAGALFWQSGQRIIYIFNAATARGRAGNARTVILDEMFQKMSGQNLIFDFESPPKPSVAEFYRSFGAMPEHYVSLRHSRFVVLEQVFRFVTRFIFPK